MNTKKILILYHTGSGSTKTICHILKDKFTEKHKVDVTSISKNFNYNNVTDYDLILLGFPTYHCEPSTSMLEFVEKMPVFNKNIKAFIFTTCGLYPGNSLRILIKNLDQKKIKTEGYMSITGPASDGILLFPLTISNIFSFISYINKYQFTTKWKLKNGLRLINKMLQSDEIKTRIPLSKWYVPINNIFKYKGQKEYIKYKDNLHILEEKCSNCNLCVKNCLRSCWEKNIVSPEFNSSNCEFCLKCVHSCPENSIIFFNKMADKPRFNNQFYSKLKKQISQSLN